MSTISSDGSKRFAHTVRCATTGLICQGLHVAPGIKVPVIPGIMPIQTYATFRRLTKLCGTYVPDSIHADLELIKACPFNCAIFFRDQLTGTRFIPA